MLAPVRAVEGTGIESGTSFRVALVEGGVLVVSVRSGEAAAEVRLALPDAGGLRDWLVEAGTRTYRAGELVLQPLDRQPPAVRVSGPVDVTVSRSELAYAVGWCLDQG